MYTKYVKRIPVNIQLQLYEVHLPYHVILIRLDYFHLAVEELHAISVEAENIIFIKLHPEFVHIHLLIPALNYLHLV